MTAARTTRTALALAPLALGLMLAGAEARAREVGEWTLRTGAAMVAPNDDSDTVEINGTAVAGTGVEVDDGYAAGIALGYLFSEHWGVELLAATPFEHRISGKGLGIDRIGEVTQLPPTLSLQWYPRDGSARLQPYVGVGVNYFLAFDEDTAGELEAALGPSDLEVHDSVGLAGQAGLDYRLDDHWSLNAAVWYIDIATEATIRTQTAGFEQIEVDVDVDPLAWMLGVSYRF